MTTTRRHRHTTTRHALRLALLLLLLATGGSGAWADTFNPTVSMTWVDQDSPSTSKGEIEAGATARAGYNTVTNESVGFANAEWHCNWITYIEVDASAIATSEITDATLSIDVSGSTDSKRTTAWGVGYNNSAWSASMTYNSADKTVYVMDELKWTTTKNSDTFETKTFNITEALQNSATRKVTLVIFETAPAGGYVKNPSVVVYHNPLCTYTVQSSLGTTIKSGEDFKTRTISYHYPQFELKNKVLYQAAKQGSNPWYGKTFALETNSQTETITYSELLQNVVVYKEGEAITGATPHSGSNADIRCSAGMGGAFSQDTPLATLPGGYYKIWGQVWGNSGTTFSMTNGGNTVWTRATTGSVIAHEVTTQLESGPLVIRRAGDKSHVLDNAYVQAIFAFKDYGSEVVIGTPRKPDMYVDSRDGVSYEIISTSGAPYDGPYTIATVSNAGDVTGLRQGQVVLRAKKTIDGQERHTDHLVTVTGGQTATATWDTSVTGRESYTLSGAGYIADAVGTTIDMAYGNTSETQTVDDGHAFCIDARGYSHAFLSGTDGADGVLVMGTYYAFTPKGINGTLTINAMVTQDGDKGRNGLRLVDQTGYVLETVSPVSVVDADTYNNYTFNTLLIAGKTYYVLAETGAMTGSGNDAYSTLRLHGFTFTKMEGTTISFIDQSLLFFPGQSCNNQRMDRTIPKFTLEFKGGTNGIFYKNGEFEIKNGNADNADANGVITIKPRIKSGMSGTFSFSSVTLNIGSAATNSPQVSVNDGTAKTIVANQNITFDGLSGNELKIKLESYGTANGHYLFWLNSVTFVYSVSDESILDDSKGSVELKWAEDFVYDDTGKEVENAVCFDSPNGFYGDVSFSYSGGTGFANANGTLTKTHVSGKTYIKDDSSDYKVRIGQGMSLLTASFEATDYFAAATAETRLYSRDYVEERGVVVAAGKSYKVPAASGLSFAITTSGGGTIALTGTAASPSAALVAGETFSTTANADAVTITNNGSDAVTITRIAVKRKQAELDFSYTGLLGQDGDVVFTGETYTPTAFTISGEDDISSKYETTGTYAVDPAADANITIAADGTLTVAPDADRGLLQVTLTVNPKDEHKALYAPVTKTVTLKVVDGLWDFRSYTQSDHWSMYDSPGWGGQSGGWYASRDNATFADIVRNDGTLLPLAIGLQTRGRHRLLHSNHGYLHLQGQGVGKNKSANGGGEVRFPVMAGMLVEVNAYSEDNLSEMDIIGVTTLEGDDVSTFYVDPGAPQSQFFLARDNGYVTVRNPSHNLDLHICYIKASADMAFKYGTETYVDAQAGTWLNPVMNQGETTIGYSYDETTSDLVTSFDTSTGQVSIGSGKYGEFTVTATGSGSGLLAGKTGTYTAHVIGFVTSDASHTIAEAHTFDLTNCITITGTDGTADDGTLKAKVRFSIDTPVPTATLSGTTLTIDEVETITVRATLGSISKTFTCELTGGTLKGGLNPVIANDREYYTITIEGESDHKFKVKEMYDAIMGDLKDSKASLKFYTGNGVEVANTTEEISSDTLHIEGFNTIKKGGVIPVYASYKHSGTTYNIEGTLTVAYTSHTWDFQANMANDLKGWKSDNGSGTAAWNSTYATIDEPTDNGARSDSYNWKFVRKIGGHPESAIVYYYNHPVEGDNALVIPETEGLHIYASPGNRQMGVEMLADDGVARVPYDVRNLMMLRGGRITIPKVKAGQWIEVRWTRHKEDMAERVLMENLSDFVGTPITSVYKIGNCFYNLDGSTSTYMFQATADGDCTFEIADNIYISIQQIELHEPTWTPVSSFVDQLKGYDDKTDSSGKSLWTIATAPTINRQYIWNDAQTPHTVTLLTKEFQNAPNAPQTWTCEMDEMLTRSGAEMQFSGEMDQEAVITYNGGWGKVKVTMTSYSQNLKYVANRKTWSITFGQAPKQKYPYTWDFTKYFADTESNLGTDSWTGINAEKTAVYSGYDTNNYSSYYVDGAQLVSYSLRNNGHNGLLPETEGLGFRLDTSSTPDGTPDATLKLDMQSTVAAARSMNAPAAEPATGVECPAAEPSGAASPRRAATTQNGSLQLSAGATIIVPAPGEDGYYIYIRSSVKPSVTNATDVSDEADAYVSNGISGGEDTFKYSITDKDANAEITFSAAATVYAIGVTNMFKTMTTVGTTAWATESRDVLPIDHTLTGELTTNDTHAYAVIERTGNPTYSDDKSRTTVSVSDERTVVPAGQGLILKQTENLPAATTYQVPLFVPAVTTAVNPSYLFDYNLLRPAVTAKTFTAETENLDGTDYTVFILAKRFMTWKKHKGSEGSEISEPTAFETNNTSAAFYRMHVFTTDEADAITDPGYPGYTEADKADKAAALNTIPANSAYLLLRTAKINNPLWTTASPSRQWAGIEGELSGQWDDAETAPAEPQQADGPATTYNLRGQAVDTSSKLPPGVYIRNGRKVVIR